MANNNRVAAVIRPSWDKAALTGRDSIEPLRYFWSDSHTIIDETLSSKIRFWDGLEAAYSSWEKMASYQSDNSQVVKSKKILGVASAGHEEL